MQVQTSGAFKSAAAIKSIQDVCLCHLNNNVACLEYNKIDIFFFLNGFTVNYLKGLVKRKKRKKLSSFVLAGRAGNGGHLKVQRRPAEEPDCRLMPTLLLRAAAFRSHLFLIVVTLRRNTAITCLEISLWTNKKKQKRLAASRGMFIVAPCWHKAASLQRSLDSRWQRINWPKPVRISRLSLHSAGTTAAAGDAKWVRPPANPAIGGMKVGSSRGLPLNYDRALLRVLLGTPSCVSRLLLAERGLGGNCCRLGRRD